MRQQVSRHSVRSGRVTSWHNGFDPDDAIQQRSRTIMGNRWIRIAAQLEGVLAGGGS
jgi:hypothetical protein